MSDHPGSASASRERELTLAMMAEATQHVVVIVRADDETDGPGLEGGGSGVCIRVGHRYFIATAGHVVGSDNLPVERFMIISTEKPKETSPRVRRRGRRSDGRNGDPFDVAYLEMEPRAAQTLRREFVPLERLACHVSAADGDGFVVCGSPAAFRSADTYNERPRTECRVMTYLTRAIPPPTDARNASTTTDLFLDYPRLVDEQAPDGWVREPPDAEGLSGGAVWLLNAAGRPAWLPSDAVLVGIQHEWHARSGWLRAAQIQLWLELVAADFEDVRELVSAHIGSLACVPGG